MAQGRDEGGTAIVGTMVGFLIIMVLLLFATQVIVRMYAESALTSAATRAAETVATSARPALDIPAAEAAARSQLGSFASRHVTFLWEEADGQQIVLLVRAESPEFLPGLAAWSRIQRTITVRTERFR